MSMNPKGRIVLLMLVVFFGLLVFFNLHWQSAPPPTPLDIAANQQNSATGMVALASSNASVATPMLTTNPPIVIGKPTIPPAGIMEMPVASEAASIPPEVVLQNVRRSIRQYGDMFKGNPVGTNPEITAALAGKNPRQINFIDAEAGLRVNNQGEMIDAWGTPYFFHQISGTEMEIHSAGPDKIMWTSDDLVAK